MAPHDVIVGKDGTVWFSSFGEQNLGRLDPKTGKVTEFPYPMHRKDSPTGSLGLRADGAGNLWLGNMYQATIIKFDPSSEKFQFWTLPPEQNIDAAQVNMVSPQRSDVDGKVWSQNNGFAGVHRLDIATGKIETWEPFKGAQRDKPTTSTMSSRTPGTTSTLPISVRGRSGASMQKPARYRYSRRQRRAPRRVAAIWMRKTASGSASIGPTGSECSTPKPTHSRNGNFTRVGLHPMTSCSTRMAMPGQDRW